ncbi:MAG: hypothetical protein ACKOC8_04975 [Pirellulales bacterium]
MNRDDLLSLCHFFASRRDGVFAGRLRAPQEGDLADPVPEILRSFHRAEISESEKNALMSLVCDPDEADYSADTACVLDPYADEQAAATDDD